MVQKSTLFHGIRIEAAIIAHVTSPPPPPFLHPFKADDLSISSREQALILFKMPGTITEYLTILQDLVGCAGQSCALVRIFQVWEVK